MQGLTVRWSLVGAGDDVLDRLRDYVQHQSFERFHGMAGLRFKTWRALPGEWFEGCYVFAGSDERDAFQADFTATAAQAPASTMLGAAPILIEPCEVLAVAEGGEGFLAAASYRRSSLHS